MWKYPEDSTVPIITAKRNIGRLKNSFENTEYDAKKQLHFYFVRDII